MPTFVNQRRGFTLMELMVILGVLIILTGIILPSIHRARESQRRIRCSENLSKLALALSQYGAANRSDLPRVIYDVENRPAHYTAFTGPDANDPFAPDSSVMPNDVTASLWLLLRGGYISTEYAPPSGVFVCPSSGDKPDPMFGPSGQPVGVRQRSNFRSSTHLSYSYANPFSNAADYSLKTDWIRHDFVLLADKNPGVISAQQSATAPGPDARPLELRAANSPNHGRAGQNVLFGDMHVEFRETPYCGVDGDNIYTAQAPRPGPSSQPVDPRTPGFAGEDVAPASYGDTYLVPAAVSNPAQ